MAEVGQQRVKPGIASKITHCFLKQEHLWQGPHLGNDIPSPLTSPLLPLNSEQSTALPNMFLHCFHLGPNPSCVSTSAKKKYIKKYIKGMREAGGEETQRVEESH